ncbi:Hypothetical protein A7982_04027 [Minicystis rosea]|nr:Hypothetical protein A7982_04027 [Minicystis rosea]
MILHLAPSSRASHRLHDGRGASTPPSPTQGLAVHATAR